LAGGQEFQNELDSHACPFDNWFAREDLKVDDDALSQPHR
jgi:hypothetical protein